MTAASIAAAIVSTRPRRHHEAQHVLVDVVEARARGLVGDQLSEELDRELETLRGRPEKEEILAGLERVREARVVIVGRAAGTRGRGRARLSRRRRSPHPSRRR